MTERRVNQQSAVDTWYRRLYNDLENNYHKTLAWSLIMMGRADAQLSQPPYRAFFNRYKDELLKAILTTVANRDPDIQYSDRELSELMAGIEKLDLNWPEFTVIANSMKRDGLLKEADVTGELDHLSEEQKLARVSEDAYAIADMTNPSKAVQMAAVSKNGYVIRYINDPDHDVKMAAAKRNGLALKYIPDATEEMQLAAVNSTPDALVYVRDPTEDTVMSAIAKEPKSIRFVKSPSEAAQLMAVKKDPFTIKSIRRSTLAAQKLAVRDSAELILEIHAINPKLFEDEEIKTAVMTKILRWVKQRRNFDASRLLKHLETNKCPWPEMAIIKKSIDSDKGRLAESDGAVDRKIEQLAYNLNHVMGIDYTNISPMNTLAIFLRLIREQEISAGDVVVGLDSIKDRILRYMLLQIKKGKITTYNIDIPLYIRELREIGVDWPELAAIERSLASERSNDNT